MLVLVTYDVNTISPGGTKRLRQVAKVCQQYGQRVQNSVFECIVDQTEFTTLKLRLQEIVDVDRDSLRFYRLGNQHVSKVEHYGVKESLDLEGPLIF
ncbi:MULTISPECIES: CRISPR-associated endonuclease Cas2 [unclassified Exiguobacterium]|uniref:CRISPR-associated endonuclease Cas2 n=1 Tax=unclassified Exiguobacterium TaxID=2644629 RepID=UPI00103ED350|nr:MULTISPECIES: CRISPR-associated endonuclease Cas2 [unclassified Exiguobacterium]TCI56157.1 CRISPR-associated endonuclease Cas2 [Exiguobacterium sp. SH5S13]TCI61741.1 CRISPR-associated endonuclease Cas2 [Exiguobacterium sp. SH3S1]